MPGRRRKLHACEKAKARLVGTSSASAGREYQLGELCIIGRSPNAQIRISDPAVSREHAKITRVEDRFIIEDLGSRAGTRVNQQEITVIPLKTNDEITIGGSTFRFVDGWSERVSTAELALVHDERAAHVISVEASEFAGMKPLEGPLDGEAMARLARRLNAMLGAGRAASSSLEPEAMLKEVLRHCLLIFPEAGRSFVAVPDRKTQTLVVRALATRGRSESCQLSLPRAVATEVLNRGRSVLAESAVRAPGGPLATEAKQSGRNGSPSGPAVCSLMVAPLICRGQMLGLIYLDGLREGSTFSQEDLEDLSGIATQVALALHSAQMYQSLLERSRTEHDLAAAREVQKHFLPRGMPKVQGFSFVAHYDPCRDVGGDLYDLISLDSNRVGIAIGDVSGKGFAAALVMAWVTSLLRVAAQQEKGPAAVLARVNEGLLEARQDDLFVTLFYGVLDRLTMSIQFSNAGHVTPLVQRSREGVVEMVEGGAGLPVGMMRGAHFDEGRILLERGDNLLLVSDGVTEATNAKRRMFGQSGLRAATGRSFAAASDLVSRVLSELRAFVGGQTQQDDITIVAVGAVGTIEDARATMPFLDGQP